jgi:hypothetical protein
MQLGETIATYDVALALRGESGKFVVTSPAGEIYHVACAPNHSIVNLQSLGNESNSQPFLIRKVAEPVYVTEKIGADLVETTKAHETKTPFLVSSDPNDLHSESRTLQPAKPETSPTDAENQSISNLDLLWVELESKSQPTVWVHVRSELQQDRGKLVTNACTTFNEFDAEVRRLHAQLDDIRYRARKRFYQAQVVAAGA